MSYLALYRKYRPCKLSEVVRQEHIIQTLTNQIKNDRIGHAYLFCGPRGTGKTSVAKIFAKAINCENNIDGEPCGKCSSCKALSEPSNLDILEIDAASNNRVDEIRDLREKVQYPPVSVKYKVYIIDEVHMLTDQAFNALLKTLEEPPKHAVFILATTEVQKLPATILSRCMRFDFKLIPLNDLIAHIKKIYDENNKKYEDEAITEIAKAGGGSVRDALSIADTCMSFSEDKLKYNDVLEILGGTDFDNIYYLAENILKGNTANILNAVNSLISNGKNINVLIKDINSFFNKLLTANTCNDANEILNLPEDYFTRLNTLAKNSDKHRMLRIMEIFSETDSSLRFASSPRILFENALIKAAMPENDFNIQALMSRISELEKHLATKDFNIISSEKQSEKVKTPENIIKKTEINKTQPEKIEIKEPDENPFKNTGNEIIESPAEKTQKAEKSKVWGLVIHALRKNKEVILYTVCSELLCDFECEKVIIKATNKSNYDVLNKPEYKEKLKNVLNELGYEDYEIRLEGQKKDEFEENLNILKQNFENTDIIIK